MHLQKKGSYVLLLALDKQTDITVGKLGTFSFSPGYFLYAGSALGGLQGRIKRHYSKEKKLHWHIDYLLCHTRILEVWGAFSEDRLECRLAQVARSLPKATVPVIGCGSSDCRCPAHLVYLPERPDLETFQSLFDGCIILEKLPMTDVP